MCKSLCMSNQTQPPKLLSLAQVSELLGVSVDTVRRICRRREIKYYQARKASAIRIADHDLRAYIDAHSVDPDRARD